MHVGIIHVNQQDRNSGGAIWSRDDFHDSIFSKESMAGSVMSIGRDANLIGPASGFKAQNLTIPEAQAGEIVLIQMVEIAIDDSQGLFVDHHGNRAVMAIPQPVQKA